MVVTVRDWGEPMTEGKTTADVCAECGHTRYVHPPNDGCDVGGNYYVDTCWCRGFRDPVSTPEELMSDADARASVRADLVEAYRLLRLAAAKLHQLTDPPKSMQGEPWVEGFIALRDELHDQP